MNKEAWMPPRPKVLTLAHVIEMIVVTKAPPGEESADRRIIEKIDSLCASGYTLTEEAAEKVEVYRRSGARH